jgi:hypothetical protein
MALAKELVNEKGIVTNYHRVSQANLGDDVLTCFVESYVSRDYREAEQSAASSVFRFDITVEEEESMGIRALCYSKIKALDAWSDAADC